MTFNTARQTCFVLFRHETKISFAVKLSKAEREKISMMPARNIRLGHVLGRARRARASLPSEISSQLEEARKEENIN
jgi:hypothetical protein